MLLKRIAVAMATVAATTFIVVVVGSVLAGVNAEPFGKLVWPSVVIGALWGTFLAVRNWGRQWRGPRM